MKTKEFKGIISQNTPMDNNLILNIIEYSCIPFNSWFETHSRLEIKSLRASRLAGWPFLFCSKYFC